MNVCDCIQNMKIFMFCSTVFVCRVRSILVYIHVYVCVYIHIELHTKKELLNEMNIPG